MAQEMAEATGRAVIRPWRVGLLADTSSASYTRARTQGNHSPDGAAARNASRPQAAGPAVGTRVIGTAGTAARIVAGAVLLGLVVTGEASRGWRPAAWALALLRFPAAALAAAWLRAWRHPAGLRATGSAGHAVNAADFGALYAAPWYAPPLGFSSDAALIFYGASMLLAAARGYAGCEVLAIPNRLLRRDDQVGCVLFAPRRHPRTPEIRRPVTTGTGGRSPAEVTTRFVTPAAVIVVARPSSHPTRPVQTSAL